MKETKGANMKFNFNFNLTGIITLLLVMLSFILIILKAVGATTFSWLQILAPFGLACAMVFIPALILFIWDNFFS